MEEQDLQRIWKNSSINNNISIQMEQLLNTFKNQMENRENIVRNRDRREVIAALLSILLFVYLTFKFWFSIPALGLIVLTVSFGYLIYRLRNNRKSKFTQDLFLPIETQLLQQKKFMERQVKLLDTVWLWAVLPMFIGYMIFTWGISNIEKYGFSSFFEGFFPESIKSKIVYTVMFALMLGYMAWTNKKAARVNWKPLIEQIDVILKNLKSEH